MNLKVEARTATLDYEVILGMEPFHIVTTRENTLESLKFHEAEMSLYFHLVYASVVVRISCE